ncbi:MAG: adenylate/guanylate cyclase protein [Chthonomonadaceae bacterium]|nr:adenylate/guanylate cyclase protein [Chthonomonadaceae bacterium]
MPALPGGTITFLFADIEGSSRLWEEAPEAMRLAVARYEVLATEIVHSHGGSLVKHRGEGDSLFAVFAQGTDAVVAALALQRAYRAEPWTTPRPLRARMALHTGEAELRDDDYFGTTVNRCARLRAIGHGGQTLFSQALCDLVRIHLPPGASLRDLGFHRLKDLQRSEHVYQLEHPDLDSEFPPLRSLNSLLHNLPLQLTSFIGREEEIREIKSLLRPKAEAGSLDANRPSRLVTLMGAGGAGKTRLALQIAAEMTEDYEHGVRLVELAALPAHSNLVAQAVAATLGVKETAGKEIEILLIDFLQIRSLLLVLDNCEHVASACALLVDRLLLACPDLTILATSRQALQSQGETTWRIPPLPVPRSRAQLTLEELARFEAVRLFVDRARAAKPHFELSAANVKDAAQICRRLDGMPFGIELAAAKTNMLSVRQIATRLDRSFQDLKGGPVTRDERQRTLTALIDWSYDLLGAPEQRLLLHLSVFAGGWTLDAMETICAGAGGEEDLFDVLSRLEQASLVMVEEQPETNRYRLLETVRQYAIDKLTGSGNAVAIQQRHRDYYVDLAEEAAPYLTRKEQGEWMQRLTADQDNLRTALAFPSDSEPRLRLAGALWRFWSMQGTLSEGRHWLKRALNDCGECAPRYRARALNGLGVLASQQNDYTTAQAALQESLQIYEALADQGGVAETLSYQGRLALVMSHYTEARSLFEHSLALSRTLGDLWGIGANLNNLGIVARSLGDSSAVKAFYEESLTLYRGLGDLAKVASVASNLGVIALDQEDYVTAKALFEESLATFRQLNDAVGIATTLHNLGAAVLKLEGHAKALPLFRDSLLRKREIGNRVSIALTLFSVAEVSRDAEDYEQAARLFACAETTWISAGMVLSREDQQMFEEAVEPVRRSLTEARFQLAWSAGKHTPFEDAVEAAIQ